MAIKGIGQARRNTRKIFSGIKGSAEKAVVEILITGRSYTLLLTPIDSGNLANSAFIDVARNKRGVRGRFGFTANYAAAVNAMPGTLKGQPRRTFGSTSNHSDVGPQQPRAFGGGTGTGNYWDPNAEPKFANKGFEDHVPEFDSIVLRNMKR